MARGLLKGEGGGGGSTKLLCLFRQLMELLWMLIGWNLATADSSYDQPPGNNRGSATGLSDLLATDKGLTVCQDDSECGHHSDSADSW